MQIVMVNPNNKRKWRLRPYSNGLCLTIEKSPLSKINKKNGKEIKAEYLSCESYPTSWSHGIRRILELMMMDPEDEKCIEIGDPAKVENTMETEIYSFLNSIKVKIDKENES